MGKLLYAPFGKVSHLRVRWSRPIEVGRCEHLVLVALPFDRAEADVPDYAVRWSNRPFAARLDEALVTLHLPATGSQPISGMRLQGQRVDYLRELAAMRPGVTGCLLDDWRLAATLRDLRAMEANVTHEEALRRLRVACSCGPIGHRPVLTEQGERLAEWLRGEAQTRDVAPILFGAFGRTSGSARRAVSPEVFVAALLRGVSLAKLCAELGFQQGTFEGDLAVADRVALSRGRAISRDAAEPLAEHVVRRLVALADDVVDERGE